MKMLIELRYPWSCLAFCWCGSSGGSIRYVRICACRSGLERNSISLLL